MIDQAKADAAVRFYRSLKHTKGKWAGVPFTLLPWQEKIIRDVFGTVRDDGFRQYKTAYVEVPKKQGKSEVAAATALKLLAADSEMGAEVYGAASDRQQASIVFDVAVAMVDQSPALKKRIKLVLSQKRMVYLPTRSYYQVLSSEAFTKHGLNPHGVVFDELHAQPNRDLYDVLTRGSGDARTQPLFFLITTAGDDPDRVSIGWDVHSYAQRVLDGHVIDPTFYSVIYGVDEDDDWEDEENWKKANPSLGHIVPIETVRQWHSLAKESPAEERNFRQLRLNQWVKYKSGKWLSLEVWDKSAGMVDPLSLRGRRCYGGLDLSTKIDLTAFVLAFPPTVTDPKWRVLPRFWVPEENLKERVARDRVPYDKWLRQGFIKTTPGSAIDYAFIEAEVRQLASEYDIAEIGFDPWSAMQTAINLGKEGLTMVEVRQGARSLSMPMKEMEALLRQEKLCHGGHPVMRWNFGNMEVKIDENENLRPVKGKGIERIDGVVALIIALSRAIVHKDENKVFDMTDITII